MPSAARPAWKRQHRPSMTPSPAFPDPSRTPCSPMTSASSSTPTTRPSLAPRPPAHDPVRAENPIRGCEQQSCSLSRPAVMITGHVPGFRLPPDHVGDRVAPTIPARRSMEDRGDPDPAPPARRPAAASDAPPESDLGRPGTARGPARRDTESAPQRAATAGHPGHDPALAPRHHPPPLGRQVHARQDRPPGGPYEHPGPGPPAGPRESRMGLPQNPRGTSRAGSQGRGVDRMGDPQDQWHRTLAAADRADLVAVPALPSRRHPGLRLLHGRPVRRHPGPRPDRDRARDPADPHHRSHAASNWGMDHAAGPQHDHRLRRPALACPRSAHPGCVPPCAATSSEPWPGWPAPPVSGSSRSSPTTWAWGKRSRSSRSTCTGRQVPPSWCARHPCSRTGNGRSPGSRPASRSGVTTVPPATWTAFCPAVSSSPATGRSCVTSASSARSPSTWLWPMRRRTSRTRAAMQAATVRHLNAELRVAVTGTPVENSLTDLWAILDWTNPGLFGTAKAFLATTNGDNLNRLVGPFLLRRRKMDPAIAAELPGKIVSDHLAELTPEQIALYTAVTRDTFGKIRTSSGIQRRGLILRMLQALRQVCNSPAHYLRERPDGWDPEAEAARSGKLAALDDLPPQRHRRTWRGVAHLHQLRVHGASSGGPPRRPRRSGRHRTRRHPGRKAPGDRGPVSVWRGPVPHPVRPRGRCRPQPSPAPGT